MAEIENQYFLIRPLLRHVGIYQKTRDYLACLVQHWEEIVISYTETLTRKVVMWCFFMSGTS